MTIHDYTWWRTLVSLLLREMYLGFDAASLTPNIAKTMKEEWARKVGDFFFLIKRTEKFQNLQPFKCFVSFGVFFNFKLRSPLIQQGRKGTRVNASLKPSCHSTPIHVHPLNVGVFVEEKCPFPRTPARPRACAFCVCFLKADKAPLPFPRRELYPQAAAPAPLSQMLLFCHEPFFGQDVTSFPPFVSGWMWMMLFQQYTVARAPRCSLT